MGMTKQNDSHAQKWKLCWLLFFHLLQHCLLWISSSGWCKWCNVAQEIILKQICVSCKSSSKLLLMNSRSFWIKFIHQNLPHFDIYLYDKYIFFLPLIDFCSSFSNFLFNLSYFCIICCSKTKHSKVSNTGWKSKPASLVLWLSLQSLGQKTRKSH
jgi:hypothetical protein